MDDLLFAVLGVIGLGSLVCIFHSVAQHAVEEPGEFGGHGLGRHRRLCIAKILSSSEINSLHTFLSGSFRYDSLCSATSDYGWGCSPAACNRIEACSWKISPSGNSWPC